MKIHAIQTGTVAIKQRQRVGVGRGMMRLVNTLRDNQWTPMLPILAWVIEHPEGLIVVDTGETARTSEPDYMPQWHPSHRFGVKMNVPPADEIGPQLQRLGLSPDDVRWVVMTHLHTDHAGGLHHFPGAEILVAREEYAAAQGFSGKVKGYLPHRWPTGFAPRLLDFADRPYATFPQSIPLTQAGDIHLVSTVGHSVGHFSVIVEDGDAAVFLAGDTSYTEAYMLDGVVDGVSMEQAAARTTLQRINAYVQNTPSIYLPAHDPESIQRLTTRQTVHHGRIATERHSA